MLSNNLDSDGNVVPVERRRRRKSLAWIYYAILAIAAAVVAIGAQQPGAIVPGILCALYSVYIFRGGRIVIWLW